MIDWDYMEELESKLHDLEAQLSSPDTAANQKRFKKLMTEHAHLKELLKKARHFLELKKRVEESKTLIEDSGSDEELRDMARQEIEEIEPQLPAAEQAVMIALLPPDPADSRNTIMEIRAGTGGDEAALFAGDLFRMYSRYAERCNWNVEIIDASESSIGGFKEIIFSVEGKEVYKKMRYESGGHRVQRIPVTETGGRIHTSAATVAVLAEVDDVDDIEIGPDDIRLDLFCASGPGGQKVNKTTSAVRITHLETGIVVQSQDERSQHRNKDRAMKVLKARLLDKQQREAAAAEAGKRKLQIGSGDRSERIRTYNFPQNRMTDHRINLTIYSLDRFMDGEIEPVINALYEKDIQERLKEEMDTVSA